MSIWAKMKSFDGQTLNKGMPIILFCLLVYLCWKLAALFWLVIAPPQLMQVQHVQLGSQQANIPQITNFALFQETQQGGHDQLDLAMTLQGVMQSVPAHLSSAVIKVNDLSERFRVGDQITGTAFQLADVAWDHVTLHHQNGQTRRLEFQGLPNGLNPPLEGDTSATGANTVAPANVPTEQHLDQASQQLNENRDQYLKNMGLNNAEHGLEITHRTPALLRQKLALRPGDRILSLNGQNLSSGQSEAQLLEQARQQGHAQLEIKRGDQVITIQQDLK